MGSSVRPQDKPSQAAYPMQIAGAPDIEGALAAPSPKWNLLPGCALLRMCDIEERIGSILVSEVNGKTGHFQSDVAVVKAVGYGVPIAPGSVVLCRHYHGKTFRGLEVAGREYPGKWKLTGRAFTSERMIVRIPYYETMPATVIDFEGQELRATGRQVIVDRGELVEQTEGGIFLPDSATYRKGTARVVSIGHEVPASYGLEIGQEVVYLTRTALPISWVHAAKRDYAFLNCDSILAVIPNE